MTVHDIRTNRPAGRSARRTSSLERRVLVALSHPSDRRSVEHALDGLGLVVRATADSASGLAMVDAFDPDVVVLDAREFHPAVTPLAIAAIERTRTGVVVMGGNSREQRLAALRHGVDDVVSTDTPADEIALRCTNVAARLSCAEPTTAPVTDDVRVFGPLALDGDRREIRVNGNLVPATKLEFELFSRICRTPFQVVTRAELIESVWGPNWYGDTHVVDVHLSNLRRKLRQRCSAVDYWYTVRGVGFRLSDDMVNETGDVRIAG